ncbi:MAG: YlzJ-like family protein [Ruminiclostridium sp.]
MILYTIYDPNVIFKNPGSGDQQVNASYSELSVDGIMMQVTQTNNKNFRIERIISTNPADYLNPRFQPGNIIHTFYK